MKRRASGDIELEDDDLLTTGEAGLLLGLTSNTVAVYIRDGKIASASRTPGGHLRIRYAAVRVVLEARDVL